MTLCYFEVIAARAPAARARQGQSLRLEVADTIYGGEGSGVAIGGTLMAESWLPVRCDFELLVLHVPSIYEIFFRRPLVMTIIIGEARHSCENSIA